MNHAISNYGTANRDFKKASLTPAYFLLFMLPHSLLYMLMSNLETILLPFAALVLFTIIMSFIFLEVFKAPIFLLYHLVFVIISQNVLAGIGMSIFHIQSDGENIKLLMVFKEIYALILITLLFIKYHKQLKLLKFEKYIPILALFMIFSFIISPADMDSRMYYTRGFAILFVSYTLGRLFFFAFKIDSERMIRKFLLFVVFSGVFVVTIGFIFNTLPRESSIWREYFSLGHVMVAKGTEYIDYAYWATPLFGHYIPRMFSFIFDAIMASYFIMTALVCSFFVKFQGINAIRLYLIIGLVLTFGKGAMGILALILVWILVLYVWKIRPRLFVPVLITGVVAAFFFLNSLDSQSSIVVHFNGLIQPLLNSPTHPVGFGVGTGGVYYAMKNDISPLTILHMGAESFFGTLIYQLGYPGLLFYVLFLIGSIKYLLHLAYKSNKIEYKYVGLSGIMFALFMISLYQEATFGINYTGILLILMGIYVSKIQFEEKQKKKPA